MQNFVERALKERTCPPDNGRPRQCTIKEIGALNSSSQLVDQLTRTWPDPSRHLNELVH